MPYSRARILAETVAKIENYPQYFRRDVGGQKLTAKIKAMLEPYGLSENEALVADIDQLTDELRCTMKAYFMNQFLEPIQ
jgi:hypothetical protein